MERQQSFFQGLPSGSLFIDPVFGMSRVTDPLPKTRQERMKEINLRVGATIKRLYLNEK